MIIKKKYDQNLFDNAFIYGLSDLKVLMKKKIHSKQSGLWSSHSKGAKGNFEYYISYTPGDDIKHVDWNIYARTQELFIKNSHQNKSLSVKILLDTSLSMSQGSPSKADVCKKVIAGIAYVVLSCGCSLQLFYSQNQEIQASKVYKRREYFVDILSFLSSIYIDNNSTFAKSLNSFIFNKNELIILFSDLFHCSNIYSQLKKISLYNELIIIHTMSQEDVSPDAKGQVVLCDIETQKKIHLEITPQHYKQYQNELQKFHNNWQSFCKKNNICYQYALNKNNIKNIIVESLQNCSFFSNNY